MLKTLISRRVGQALFLAGVLTAGSISPAPAVASPTCETAVRMACNDHWEAYGYQSVAMCMEYELDVRGCAPGMGGPTMECWYAQGKLFCWPLY